MIWEKLSLFWVRDKDEAPQEHEGFRLLYECAGCGVIFPTLTAWRAHWCGG